MYYSSLACQNSTCLILEQNKSKVNWTLDKYFNTKKTLFWVTVTGIIFLGVFLRAYHFSDWMRFELDQARDSNVIKKALSGGVGELPLLGPKARGTFLRLGPAFYYMEYASAKLFGGNPPAMAFSVLFFSVLSLPLFLFFLLCYFNRKISLLLLLLFSSSIFLVMYSRFAWNPNPLVFFVLLFSFSLLKAVSLKGKNKGWWLVLSAVSLSLATQLHFVAFLAMPVVAVVFLLFKRPKISLRYWIFAIAVVLFFYVPVFVNEIKTGGDNVREFVKAVANKGDKKEDEGIARKIYFNFSSHADSYALILSGKNNGEYFAFNPKGNFEKNSSEAPALKKYSVGTLGVLFFIVGSLFIFWRVKKEKTEERKSFLLLNSIWLTVSFLLFAPISLDLSPRFFLLVPMLPFIFLGIFLESIDKSPKKFQAAIFGVVLLLFFGNFSEIWQRFHELGNAHIENVAVAKRDDILKETNRVTYLQQNLIIDYMKEKQKDNGFPVYFFADPRHLTSFEYLLEKENIISGRLPYREIYREGNYFFINFSNLADRYDISKYARKYDILTEEKDFGTLTVISLSPKPELVLSERQDFSEKEKENRSKAPKRYKWNEVFGGEVGDEEDFNEDE